MRKILFLALTLIAYPVWASCPFLEMSLTGFSKDGMIMVYRLCAENHNDDDSQAKLATIYDRGLDGVAKDMKKALYYYQLSADNGNAASQTRLAELYMQLDKNRENRAIVYDYMKSLSQRVDAGGENNFHGELVHPYVLLILANEKPENKWYYPTKVKKASDNAKMLYKNFEIDENKKSQLMKQATAWKKRKLLEIAKQVLSEAEYQNFVNTLYPSAGYGDAFRRNQALKMFQEKVKQREQQDLENAKAFY